VILPPLRTRNEDIPDLVNHFTAEISAKVAATVRRVSPEAMELLRLYEWPGNVRELRNVIERCLVLAEGDTLTVDDLPAEIADPGEPAGEAEFNHDTLHGEQGLDAVQRHHIGLVISHCRGNKRLAARRLGISRSTLYERLKLMTTSHGP
jgi:DNA-binding NtrC family response regulator